VGALAPQNCLSRGQKQRHTGIADRLGNDRIQGRAVKTMLDVVTPEKLEKITKRIRPSAQIRALRKMGIPHRVRPDGTPLVMDADLTLTGHQREGRSPTPDYDAL